jgi:hypothetical protein
LVYTGFWFIQGFGFYRFHCTTKIIYAVFFNNLFSLHCFV